MDMKRCLLLVEMLNDATNDNSKKVRDNDMMDDGKRRGRMDRQ